MKPTTIPGFHICDDYGEQQLIAVAGIEACDKRWARWEAENLRPPPPKSKLLATEPNWIEYIPWLSDDGERDAMDNDKPIDAEWDWGKA